jgi:hypothetical protein
MSKTKKYFLTVSEEDISRELGISQKEVQKFISYLEEAQELTPLENLFTVDECRLTEYSLYWLIIQALRLQFNDKYFIDLDKVYNAYVECALWSSVDDNEKAMDSLDYPLAKSAQIIMRRDCIDFVESNRSLLIDSDLTADQIGHDFWLTRNHHGAGFWDRGLGEIGKLLTEACHRLPEQNLYVDRKRIYLT